MISNIVLQDLTPKMREDVTPKMRINLFPKRHSFIPDLLSNYLLNNILAK